MAAFVLVLDTRFEPSLVFRREWRLLLAQRLRLIVARIAAIGAEPLAREIGIFGLVMRAGHIARQAERCRQRERTDQTSIEHQVPPQSIRLSFWQTPSGACDRSYEQ